MRWASLSDRVRRTCRTHSPFWFPRPCTPDSSDLNPSRTGEWMMSLLSVETSSENSLVFYPWVFYSICSWRKVVRSFVELTPISSYSCCTDERARCSLLVRNAVGLSQQLPLQRILERREIESNAAHANQPALFVLPTEGFLLVPRNQQAGTSTQWVRPVIYTPCIVP